MNYFTGIKKSLLLVIVALFVQSCDQVCIKSNDFGEQANVDLFKISARDLSTCTFSIDNKSGSYDNLPRDGILKKCMEGYRYDEDKNEYSEEPTETVYSLIKGGYFDLENTRTIFDSFESNLETEQDTRYEDFMKNFYCKDFDYLKDSNSRFITSFSTNDDSQKIINSNDLPDLNLQIYIECGH